MAADSLDKIYINRTKPVDSIFVSYRELYEMYMAVMKNAKVGSSLQAFESAKRSADTKQIKLAKQLYSQGFVLISGIAEALLKEIFESLLTENFAQIKNLDKFDINAKDIQSTLSNYSKGGIFENSSVDDISYALGFQITKKIFATKNPNEKVNFQNVNTMIENFNHYFGIDLSGFEEKAIVHRAWQVRHCVVHNDSVIDDRFIHNVKIVEMLRKDERKGTKLAVAKDDFLEAKQAFINLFTQLESEIRRKELSFIFIDLPF